MSFKHEVIDSGGVVSARDFLMAIANALADTPTYSLTPAQLAKHIAIVVQEYDEAQVVLKRQESAKPVPQEEETSDAE